MREVMINYGDCTIYIARPYGYKRYYVEWADGRSQMYSGLWYSKNKVKKLVEAQLS